MKLRRAFWKRNWRPQVGWGVPIAWLTLCVVWSSTWLVIKVGLRDLPPISYAAIRFVIAVVVLLLLSAGRVRLLPESRSDYILLGFTGVLMFAVNYGLLFWGELYVSSGLAAVLQATIPIFGMVFAHLMHPDETRNCARSCRRGVLERAAQSACDPAGASDDRGMADDFRGSTFARNRIYH